MHLVFKVFEMSEECSVVTVADQHFSRHLSVSCHACWGVSDGYILEGYSHDVQGQYGKNTAVRLTAPDGAKVTLWVNGFEEEHFKTFVATRVEQAGHQLPVKVSFLRTQRTAEKTGRTYNKIQFRLDAAGEDVQFELESL